MPKIGRALWFQNKAQIIPGNVSASRVLLDGQVNIKLVSFVGLAMDSAALLFCATPCHKTSRDYSSALRGIFTFGPVRCERMACGEPMVAADDTST